MNKFKYNPDPRYWDRETESGEWWTEAQDVALTGVPAYCQRFFAELFNEFPVLVQNVIFLRWSVQPAWIYAVFNVSDSGFSSQIYADEGHEYIVVGGPNGGAEYCSWEEDLLASALSHIREIMSLFER